MSELSGKMEDKKRELKSLISRLHEGANFDEIREDFKEVIGGITPTDIAQIEEELIEEGMPREEVQRLCDVHLAVFKESLEKEKILAPAGHPIYILMEEHRLLLEFMRELKDNLEAVKGASGFESVDEEMKRLTEIEEHLKESESHYLREENVLFPYLERHGVTQPPAIMWAEHDKIREIKKNLYGLVDTRESIVLEEFVTRLNNILFPTAMKVIEAGEWKEIGRQFDELGYCCFTPEPVEMITEVEKPTHGLEVEGIIRFDTGSLSREEAESLFNTLPVDITFVDKEDTVRYFSQSRERIFPRTKAVIGRKVQQCHPQASLPKVIQILEDFKNRRRDTAEFWINRRGRLIHIRYFAVRNKEGNYLGCMEVTQDITDIQKITGEKRLLE